ncbi:EAL domain-containing protein [Vibrio alfacsensis]|uniref:EAL domain-containing protein n=1 Tax=Vibrio alfacsensis TaxID=1074311 RepID=UPI002ADDF15B|nr:EAL domain-containing protein [Vibrio alfacsensis]WQE75387.1 EAL domain-containing protein [Vibrio alfacsensis]
MSTLNFIYSSDAYYISDGTSHCRAEFLFHKIVDLRSHLTIYYEVLSQLTYQSGEDYDNTDFFANVDNQFIKKLSLTQLKYVRRKTLPHPPSINLTLSCLEDGVFIKELLRFADLKFALEITDVDIEIDNLRLKKHLNALRAAGIKLWLDDYRLDNKKVNATLGEIAWDRIKIDISAVPEYRTAPEMLSSLLFVLSPFVTESIVFEGIETEQEATAISHFKASGQGYYYQFPKKWASIGQEQKSERNESVFSTTTRVTENIESNHSKRVA